MVAIEEDGAKLSGWAAELGRAVTRVPDLLARLELDAARVPALPADLAAFPLRVPCGYVARMEKGNPLDPLLRQVLPTEEEGTARPGLSTDPLDEGGAQPVPGLLRKYAGRVLLLVTGSCAVHCRFCFRRHFPFRPADPARWDRWFEVVAADATIEEVILSGGDPLICADDRLRELTDRICAVGHVRRVRIHTRLPVLLPERVDDGLLAWLRSIRLPTIFVVHANHAREIDDHVHRALRDLRETGVTLLNQSVLLRGVNDSVEALRELSTTLAASHVLPYYLHLLDRVKGAAPFEVPEARAVELVGRLAAGLSGYLVPRLARELPGAEGKLLVPGGR